LNGLKDPTQARAVVMIIQCPSCGFSGRIPSYPMFGVGEYAKLSPRDRIRLVSRGFLARASSFCRHIVVTM
ncbi:MAG: hypothetical protein ACXVBO_20120, partial [Isosphaeraceae bacterium]